jgi:hypothetical protein
VYQSPADAFIDDAFALRDDGGALAYLTTDGASAAVLHLCTIDGDGGGGEVTVPGLPANVVALYWLGAERVLVVTRDGERRAAQAYGRKGAEKERLGPADAIAPAVLDGKRAVVTHARVLPKKGPVEHVLTAYRADGLRPLAKKALREEEGRIVYGGEGLKLLWWADGLTRMAALRPGDYDQARDIRRPERFVELDVFSGRLGEEHVINDVLGFGRVAAAHRDHEYEAVFPRFNDDHSRVLLTDGMVDYEVPLARPLSTYDPATLAYQALDDGRVALSLTVDPVNPGSLKRKKADPDEIDLYFVDRKSHAAALGLRLDGRGRPSAWRIGGGRLALLRKSKGFDRGGVALEIYALR